jgi:hypothetical protein
MIRITQDETKNYVELDINDHFICQKATAYTCVPDPSDIRWSVVTYYGPVVNPFSYLSKSDHTSRVRVDYKNPRKQMF